MPAEGPAAEAHCPCCCPCHCHIQPCILSFPLSYAFLLTPEEPQIKLGGQALYTLHTAGTFASVLPFFWLKDVNHICGQVVISCGLPSGAWLRKDSNRRLLWEAAGVQEAGLSVGAIIRGLVLYPQDPAGCRCYLCTGLFFYGSPLTFLPPQPKWTSCPFHINPLQPRWSLGPASLSSASVGDSFSFWQWFSMLVHPPTEPC